MDWGSFVNSTAQNWIGNKVSPPAVPSAPISVVAATGQVVVDGKPAQPTAGGMMSKASAYFSAHKAMVLGGAAVLLVGGYFLLRKK